VKIILQPLYAGSRMTPSLIGNEDKPVDDQWNNINSKEKYQTMRLYYKIWVDFITRLRLIDGSKDNWELTSMITMSVAMTFNLISVMSILQRHIFHYYFFKLSLPFFSSFENNIFSILILFLLPCSVINHLLIFRRERYEMLLKKYPYNNGRLFVAYFSISLFFPMILMWIGIFLYH